MLFVYLGLILEQSVVSLQGVFFVLLNPQVKIFVPVGLQTFQQVFRKATLAKLSSEIFDCYLYDVVIEFLG